MFGSKEREERMTEAVNRVASEVAGLKASITVLTNLMGRVVFPAEAMVELTGELRALRLLIDREGTTLFMDKERIKSDQAKRTAAAQAELRKEVDVGHMIDGGEVG